MTAGVPPSRLAGAFGKRELAGMRVLIGAVIWACGRSCALARGATAAETINFRHGLEGRGRARRLLPGDRHRHLPAARARSDVAAGRTAGQPCATARRRPARLQPRAKLLHPAEFRAGEHPDGRGRGDLPEGPVGADRPSRAGQRQPRRTQRQADHDRLRHPHHQLGFPEEQVRLHRRPDPALHLQRRAVPRRPQGGPAGLSVERAVHDRSPRA